MGPRRCLISALPLALIALAAAGCGPEEKASGRGEADGGEADGGEVPTPPAEFTFEADLPGALFQVLKDGQPLVELPRDGLALGLLPALDDGTNYDPLALLGGPGGPPEGLEWVTPASIRVVARTETELSAELDFGGGLTATLTVVESESGRFDATLRPASDASRVAYYRVAVRTDPTEGFYGMGEVLDSVNHRGKVRAMQLELDGTTESGYNEAHVPIPLVTGTRGWGFFVASQLPMAFDVAKAAADRVDAYVGAGLASAEGIAFHLIGVEHPLDVTRHYHDLTGRPARPARWALGPLLWRNENRDQAQVIDDMETLRDLDLATTGLWIDRPYATAVNTFDFDPVRFPDPPAMIARAHALGLRVALWHTPYLDPASPATAALREQATAGGYFPPQAGILFHNWGPPVDFTVPAARDFWKDKLRAYQTLGIEGYKLDYGEDVVLGLGALRIPWKFGDGSDERTMHAGYQSLYHEVYADMLPDEGGMLLCRASTFGDQSRASIIWPGDLDATMARFGESVTRQGETYSSVGGLPASVIAGLSLGASGFPLFGSDTGGYRHSPPDEETFVRWFQQTALSPVMQIGTASSTVAWELAENGFSPEVLELYRDYVRLHLRLWPYLWTYLERAVQDGRPIARALGLAHPELGEHPDDQYLLGEHLLVAPVVNAGATSRDVLFPAGEWVDFWTGEKRSGAGWETVEAPRAKLPLYLAAGGIVPMLRPTIDTLSPTTEPERVDSYATTPGVLGVRVTSGPASTFTLFDGTTVGQASDAESLTLRATMGQEFTRGVLFEVIGWGSAPGQVEASGVSLEEAASAEELGSLDQGWFHDPDAASGTLWVRTSGGEPEIRVVRREK